MYSKKHFPPLAGSAFLCLLFHDLRVQQVKDRLVGAPEVGLLAEREVLFYVFYSTISASSRSRIAWSALQK